jgi:hypothetical protein
MPDTGRWWETNRRKDMIGIVNHESEGKKWTSKYSDDLGKSIRQTVIVDGFLLQ